MCLATSSIKNSWYLCLRIQCYAQSIHVHFSSENWQYHKRVLSLSFWIWNGSLCPSLEALPFYRCSKSPWSRGVLELAQAHSTPPRAGICFKNGQKLLPYLKMWDEIWLWSQLRPLILRMPLPWGFDLCMKHQIGGVGCGAGFLNKKAWWRWPYLFLLLLGK